MLLKHSITFCIILTLCSSTFAEIYTINKKWEAEIKKCRTDGDENRIYNYKILDPAINNLGYNFFEFDTTIKAGGIFELKSGFTDDITYSEWALYEFDLINDVKIYKGELRVEASDNFIVTQVAHWQLTLSIRSNGSIEMQNHVYAGSWGSVYCTSAKSFVNTLTIAR